jgi:transcriptional regulator with XRE-family HTH domain
MPESDIFSERLRNAREMRKLTQTELGTKAKLPSTSIAHFETGSRKPSFDNLRKLAEALKVTTDYLLGRVPDPFITETGDALFRDIGKLSDYDRRIAENFLRMLTNKDSKSE